MWYAKPYGGYSPGSTEFNSNVEQINGYLNTLGANTAAQAGLLGNVYAESGMNPWRWEGDTVAQYRGYGLFQYTPAYSRNGVPGYIDTCGNVPYYAPNLSTSAVTSGANANDGFAQLAVFSANRLNKWMDTMPFASGWDLSFIPQRNNILAKYGTNGHLSIAQFYRIDNINDAVFAFLTAFERPAVLSTYYTRCQYAASIYPYLSGDTPINPPAPPPVDPDPEPEPPIVKKAKKMPIYFYLKRY